MIISYNVWKIFYIILASAFIVFSILLYVSFKGINERHHTEVEYYSQIISKTINTKLLQNEMMLDLLGKQLLENDNYKNREQSVELLDSILKKNPFLAAFGLADIDGNIIASSSNIKPASKISHDFKAVLKSKEMYVGKTYNFSAINDWIIPLRKTIRDENGKILGVMTSGLRNSKNNNYLDTLKLSVDKNVVIILDSKENSLPYRIYFSNAGDKSNEELYLPSLPKNLAQHFVNSVKEKYNYSADNLRMNGKTISFEGLGSFGINKISAVTYDKEYSLWIVVSVKYSEIWDEFFELLFIYTMLLIVIFVLFFILFKNIATSEKRKKGALIFQAQHDALTKLPNRAYMYDNIDEWLSKYKEKYCVLFIDLDNFKNINDRFGHTVGDSVLVEVAKRLESFFDEESMLIRQGGDEFIILQACPNKDFLENKLLTLIDLISKVYYIDGKEFRIGMSVGISNYPKDSEDIEVLLSLADTAMYEAKKKKNSYCFFSEDMQYCATQKAEMEQELRGALEREELWVAYQPQIDRDGKLYGVEALIRWESKKLGCVGPDKFISIAEDIGIIREFGEFILRTSLSEIKAVQEELNSSFRLSINISALQLIEKNFLEILFNHIEDINFDKTRLTIEITESQFIEDMEEVVPLLLAIREEGIEISLDDFGTGYSSLSILRDLPINELKIDKAFIDKILNDTNDKALVQSIVNIGKNFGMKTLAEGIETLEQVKALKDANCDIFQGYFYSKPLAKKEFLEYVKERHDDRG